MTPDDKRNLDRFATIQQRRSQNCHDTASVVTPRRNSAAWRSTWSVIGALLSSAWDEQSEEMQSHPGIPVRPRSRTCTRVLRWVRDPRPATLIRPSTLTGPVDVGRRATHVVARRFAFNNRTRTLHLSLLLSLRNVVGRSWRRTRAAEWQPTRSTRNRLASRSRIA